MAKPKYRRAHQKARAKYQVEVDAGRGFCAEPVCLIQQQGGSRWIPPGSRWHLCHDPSGSIYIGPGHEKCNSSEGAKRGNSMRGSGGPAKPPTHGRWLI